MSTLARPSTAYAPRPTVVPPQPKQDSGRARVIFSSVLMVASAGMAAGLMQALIVVVRSNVLNEFTFTSRDIGWMAPVSDTIFAIPVMVVAAFLALILPAPRALRVAAFLATTFCAYVALLPFPRIHPLASFVLALGLGAQCARFVAARPDTWCRRAPPIAAILALVVACTGGGTIAWRAVGERMGFAALPVPRAGSPNVLLLILDTVRAADLGLYGYARPTTPFLDAWAREGVVYDWAMAPAPWTLPSHASMFTGRNADALSTGYVHELDETYPVLAEALRNRGYATGAFTANFEFANHETGLTRGFIHLEDFLQSPRQLLLSGAPAQTESFRDLMRSLVRDHSPVSALRTLIHPQWYWDGRINHADRKNATQVTGEFLRWRESLNGRPYFAFLNFFDAHWPYEPLPVAAHRFAHDSTSRDLYDDRITSLDRSIAQLLAELRRRGELDNTIVILTSDHGEQFGEHGKWSHSNSLYAQLLHVPLVVRYPARVTAGTRVHETVTLVNVAATVLDLAEIHDTGGLAGTSIAPAADGTLRDGRRSAALSELEGYSQAAALKDRVKHARSLVDDSLHLIVQDASPDRLYAYRRDRGEDTNLAADRSYAAVLGAMRRKLAQTAVSEQSAAGARHGT